MALPNRLLFYLFVGSVVAQTDDDFICLPHQCSSLEIEIEQQDMLLDFVKKELDALPAFNNVADLITNDIPALLITVGGPERGESIVQAHVLMDTVRSLHHDEDTIIEVWHAGEPGMDQACEVWTELFPPFSCHNAHEMASVVVSNMNSDGPITAVAQALGLDETNIGQFSKSTIQPSLEWVRGWPIKPLALLLTQYDKIIMLDADSIPLIPLNQLFSMDDVHGSISKILDVYGNLFWPDITQMNAKHHLIRKSLGLVEKDYDANENRVLSAESGQIILVRSRCLAVLRAAWVLNAHPVIYNLLHGDKDTFSIAFDWTKHHQVKHPGDSVKKHEEECEIEAQYYQVSMAPQSLGALGPQNMVDGTMAADTRYGRGRRICGQSLLQRHPIHQEQVLFVHRVFAKYNIMNLHSVDSWSWYSNPPAEENDSHLVQSHWCVIEDDRGGDGKPILGITKSPDSILRLAKHAIQARRSMNNHF